MDRRKLAFATLALAMGLSTGAFAEEAHSNKYRDHDDRVYAQPYEYSRSDWSDGYRERGRYRDREHYRRDRDDDRGHMRRDHDERGWYHH